MNRPSSSSLDDARGGLGAETAVQARPAEGTEDARADFQDRADGDRPVTAVIYTHSHIDHFGRVLGMVDADTNVPIYAPDPNFAVVTP